MMFFIIGQADVIQSNLVNVHTCSARPIYYSVYVFVLCGLHDKLLPLNPPLLMPFTRSKWSIIKVSGNIFWFYVMVLGFRSCPLGCGSSPAYLAHSSFIEII